MFMSYEVVSVFGISAMVSFVISATLLLTFAAKKGMLRIGSRRKESSGLLPQHLPKQLLPVELMPLKTDKVPL